MTDDSPMVAQVLEQLAEYLEGIAADFARNPKGAFWTRPQLETFLLREAARAHQAAAGCQEARTESEVARAAQAQVRFREGVAARGRAAEEAKPDFRKREREARRETGLRVYQGDVDWVVARDPGDALAVVAEHYGTPYHEAAGISEEEAREEWSCAVDADTPLTVWTEISDWKFRRPEAGEVHAATWPVVWTRGEHTVCETAPVWWWAQKNGRGFLASTEY